MEIIKQRMKDLIIRLFYHSIIHIHKTESDSIIKNYLKRHGDEEGCAMYYIMRRALINETMRDTISKETLKEMIPQSIFEGRMKKVIDHYMKI